MSPFIMVQYSLKKGLKKYPKKGSEVIIKEMIQLHNRGVMEPLVYGSLTSEQKREFLISLMFLTEKEDG